MNLSKKFVDRQRLTIKDTTPNSVRNVQ